MPSSEGSVSTAIMIEESTSSYRSIGTGSSLTDYSADAPCISNESSLCRTYLGTDENDRLGSSCMNDKVSNSSRVGDEGLNGVVLTVDCNSHRIISAYQGVQYVEAAMVLAHLP